MRICEDSQDMQNFGRGFARNQKILGEDLQGITRLWERIHEDLQGFLGFTRIHETLGEHSQGLMGICEDS